MRPALSGYFPFRQICLTIAPFLIMYFRWHGCHCTVHPWQKYHFCILLKCNSPSLVWRYFPVCSTDSCSLLVQLFFHPDASVMVVHIQGGTKVTWLWRQCVKHLVSNNCCTILYTAFLCRRQRFSNRETVSWSDDHWHHRLWVQYMVWRQLTHSPHRNSCWILIIWLVEATNSTGVCRRNHFNTIVLTFCN